MTISGWQANARGPGIMDHPEYIAKDARPILFFPDRGKNQKVVIRQCDVYSVAPTEDSCKAKKGTHDYRVGAAELRKNISVAMLDPNAHHDPKMASKIREYARDRLSDTERAFIKAFYEGKSEGDSSVTGLLKMLNYTDELFSGSHPNKCNLVNYYSPAKDEIDRRIEHLVDGILTAGHLLPYSKSQENRGFDYNVLKSYFNAFALPDSKKQN